MILLLLKKIHDGTISHLVTYHNTIKNAQIFAKLIELVNETINKQYVYIKYLDGSMSMYKRKRIIKEYINYPQAILCTSKVLNEGVNIPIIDSICFVDSRQSEIDIIQCIGRCLRLHNKKTKASILVPVIMNSLNDDIINNDYDTILKIVKSLKTIDDSIIEYFGTNTQNKKENRYIFSHEKPSNIIFGNKIDLNQWISNINGNIIEINDPFMYNFTKLKLWIESYKSVPSDNYDEYDDYDEYNEACKLLDWCNQINDSYISHKLSDDKIKYMESLSLWKWNDMKRIQLFSEKYNELLQWIDMHKKLPSRISCDDKEREIGDWLYFQILLIQKNKLNANEIESLNILLDKYPIDHDNIKKKKTNTRGKYNKNITANKIKKCGTQCIVETEDYIKPQIELIQYKPNNEDLVKITIGKKKTRKKNKIITEIDTSESDNLSISDYSLD